MLKNEKEIITKKTPSAKPFYVVAVIWVIGTFILPMYKAYSYLILGVISVVAYFLMRQFLFPDEVTEIEVESKRSYFNQQQQEFIENGTASLKNIIALNKEINSPALNNNVNELVTTSDEILDYVYEHERSVSSLRKIVDYYLPTIEKLLTRYQELQDSTADNVVESKTKIENIIATTNTAFKNQLVSMYDTDTLDINAEVKVLEQIYIQEGLIDSQK